jgi:hypothetical protein
MQEDTREMNLDEENRRKENLTGFRKRQRQGASLRARPYIRGSRRAVFAVSIFMGEIHINDC